LLASFFLYDFAYFLYLVMVPSLKKCSPCKEKTLNLLFYILNYFQKVRILFEKKNSYKNHPKEQERCRCQNQNLKIHNSIHPNPIFIQNQRSSKTKCSSKTNVHPKPNVHPKALFIQELCSSKSYVHPKVMLIQKHCSSKSTVHPTVMFIQKLCSSITNVHPNKYSSKTNVHPKPRFIQNQY